MRNFTLALAGLALFFGISVLYGEEALVKLTMDERVGVAREGEYITIGVPLPKGTVAATDELVLLSKGKPIPAEILPVNKWWDDGSLRWVHLIFQGDCAAKGSASVTLAKGDKTPASKETVKVSEWSDKFVIDTGALVFEVLKKRFNVIDKAIVDGEVVMDGHDRGLGVLVEGKEYLAALDRNVNVYLEEQGPLHVVLRATGSFKHQETSWGKLSPEKKLDFDCRLYAYAGSPDVKVVVSITNRQGALADYIPLSALFLELPTTVKKGNCIFGTEEGGINRGSLASAPDAYIYQPSSSEHIFGGAVTGKGGGKETKPDTMGWGDLSDGKKGLAVGVRWFWQLYPKAIDLTADGTVRAGLYSRRYGKPLKIYTGVARTHELRLSFHKGKPDPKRLMGVFAGLQKPLRPFALPQWYCRDTQGLGDYCEAGGTELYGPYADKVKQFDDAFEAANRRCQNFRDSRTKNGVTRDSYGFLEFGDGFHHAWNRGVDVPENIAWNGNYYGYPHMMLVQFMRTGNVEYFDNFEAHALHVADVHTVHHTDRKELVGACRYCPPTDHVRVDPKGMQDYKTARVYVSDSFCHHKVAGVIGRWYLLRDHRSLDIANLILDHTYRYNSADNNFSQPRAPGMIMEFCYQAYMLTGDERWIPRGKNVLRIHQNRDLTLSFQAGIFCEGLRRYYEMSGDPAAFDYLKKTADQLIEQGKRGGTTAQTHSFLYLKTGDPKYLEAALRNLPTNSQFGNPWKEYALSMRNAAMCIADLYHAAQKPPTPPAPPAPPTRVIPKLGEKVTLKPTKDARITGYPSEAHLNSGGATRLRARDISDAAVEMFIMDFDHALVKAFLDQKKGKKIEAKLVLQYREHGGGKLEVATLDSSVDWGEGKSSQGPASKGDCSYVAARTGVKAWTTVDGKEVANLRDLIYDRSANKIKTLLSSKGVQVEPGVQTVTVPLDMEVVKHLATDPNCRGLVFFTRSPVKIDVYSAEQSGREPKLMLVASEAKLEQLLLFRSEFERGELGDWKGRLVSDNVPQGAEFALQATPKERWFATSAELLLKDKAFVAGEELHLAFDYFLQGTNSLTVFVFDATVNDNLRYSLPQVTTGRWTHVDLPVSKGRRGGGRGLAGGDKISELYFYGGREGETAAKLLIANVRLYNAK